MPSQAAARPSRPMPSTGTSRIARSNAPNFRCSSIKANGDNRGISPEYVDRRPPNSITFAPACHVSNVAHPNSAANRATRTCPPPIHCPPRSNACPSTTGLNVRPPTRSRASSTTTRRPAAATRRAATNPDNPAPTTITSVSLMPPRMPSPMPSPSPSRNSAGMPPRMPSRITLAPRPDPLDHLLDHSQVPNEHESLQQSLSKLHSDPSPLHSGSPP